MVSVTPPFGNDRSLRIGVVHCVLFARRRQAVACASARSFWR